MFSVRSAALPAALIWLVSVVKLPVTLMVAGLGELIVMLSPTRA